MLQVLEVSMSVAGQEWELLKSIDIAHDPAGSIQWYQHELEVPVVIPGQSALFR